MSNIPITTGSGTASVAAETVGGISYQQIEVYGGGGASVLSINPDGSLKASIVGTVIITGSVQGSFSTANQSVSGTVGASIIGAVPITGTVGASILGAVNFQLSQNTTGNDTDSASQLNMPVGPISASHGPMGAATYVYNGQNWDRLRGNSVMGALVTPYALPTSVTSGVTSIMTQTTSVLVLAAPAGTMRNYITHVLVTNNAAVTTTVSLVDNGNIIWSGNAGASGGGWSENFIVPLIQPTSVKALYVISSVQASVIVAVNGFTGT